MKSLYGKLTLLALGVPALAADNYYTDPARRFQTELPAGWSTANGQGGARLSCGNAWVQVMVFPGVRGASRVADALIRQIGPQWQHFEQAFRGRSQLAGLPADKVIFAGHNPRGVAAVLQVIATENSTGSLVLLMSAPGEELHTAEPAFDRIVHRFRFGKDGPNRVSQPAPPRQTPDDGFGYQILREY